MFHIKYPEKESPLNIDISKIWPDWTITERLGHGGFGHVYKEVCESTQTVAAVKVIPLPMNAEDITDHRAMDKSDRKSLVLWRKMLNGIPLSTMNIAGFPSALSTISQKARLSSLV